MARRTKSLKAARAPFSVIYADGYLSASINLTAKQIAIVIGALLTSPVAIEILKALLNVR